MTPDIILIIAGCLLLVIGLVGGGVKSQYGEVGKVDGRFARTLCVIIGFVLIGIGVAIKFWPQTSKAVTPATKQEAPIIPETKTEPSSAPVEKKSPPAQRTTTPKDPQATNKNNEITIHFTGKFTDDKRGVARIVLDDSVKAIVTNRNNLESAVTVVLTKPGPHPYTVSWTDGYEANTVQGSNGAYYESNDSGTLFAKDGSIFEIHTTTNGYRRFLVIANYMQQHP